MTVRINLTYVQFDLEAYQATDKAKMTKTAQDFFYTLFEFEFFMVDDSFQDQNSDTPTCFFPKKIAR